MNFTERRVTPEINEALSDRPVVLLNGARQTGKSTLAEHISGREKREFFTMDDFTILSAVKSDPKGFIEGLNGPVSIDEVQRAPELLLAIKAAVDKERTPGMFLLTGSANVMSLPRIADSLAGRIEIITLRPFSAGEITGSEEQFIDRLFSTEPFVLKGKKIDRESLFETILTGGYPEVRTLRSESRRMAWFKSYITTLLQRDVQDLSKIEGLSEIPRLLSIVASRSASLLNMSETAREIGLSHMTLKRYIALLEAVFLIRMLPAWFGNIGKRLIKSPKVFLNDTGLLGYLLGINTENLLAAYDKTGPVIENFVMQELDKQKSWSRTQTNLFYYRTAGNKEIDFILETPDRRIAGIEVKAGFTVKPDAFKGLKDLEASAGERFHRGVVLYFGDKIVPFGKKLHALPINALWE